MRLLRQTLAGFFVILATSAALGQQSGDAMRIEYGTIKAMEAAESSGKRAGGTLVGGLAGAAIADDHRGLGAIAGGLLGGGIQKRTTKSSLMDYKIKLVSGATVVVATEQMDMVVGDCVLVERGQYTNIRRVSDINCIVKKTEPEPHHKEAASNCQKAKDELNNAKTDEAIENAVIKVRTLCED
jgi:outer membrane lipoprotein SlyB